MKVPAIDIHTVGAGGGSIAHRDAGGALKVGPESAGADPGPACYGRGAAPTVTDANVVLGRLPADAVPRRPHGAASRTRAPPRSGAWPRRCVSTSSTLAEGVVRVVNAGMERAIRQHLGRARPRPARLYARRLRRRRRHARLRARRRARHAAGARPRASGPAVGPGRRDRRAAARLRADRAPRRSARTRARAPPAPPRAACTPRAARRGRSAGAYPHRHRARRALSRPVLRAARCRSRRATARQFHAAHRALYGYADEQRAVEVVNLRVIATAPIAASGGVAAQVPAPVAISGHGGGSGRGPGRGGRTWSAQ